MPLLPGILLPSQESARVFHKEAGFGDHLTFFSGRDSQGAPLAILSQSCQWFDVRARSSGTAVTKLPGPSPREVRDRAEHCVLTPILAL